MTTSTGKILKNNLLSVFRRFFVYASQDKRYFILNFVLIAFVITTGAAMIWMVGRGIDELQDGEFSILSDHLIIFALLILVLQGLRYINRYFNEWLQQRIIYTIRRHLYSHLLVLSIPFKNIYPHGDLLTRLAQDVTRVAGLLVIIPGFLFSHSLTFVTYFGILFYINYQLAALAVFLIPAFILQQRYFSKQTRLTSREFLSWQGKMGGLEEETLTNLQGIASFAAEPAMLKRFDTIFARYRQSAMRHLLLQNGYLITYELLAALSALLLIGLGVHNIQASLMSTGELVNFLLYLGYLAVPLRGLSNIPVKSQIRVAAAERIAEIIDTIPEVPDSLSEGRTSPITTQDKIKFENVDFAYTNAAPILKNFSLAIRHGEFIALVGPSGAGKSTLAKLLLRFYDPNRGRILLDGHDIRHMSLENLRTRISVVWQQPFLINDNVFENMRLAKTGANEDEILTALHKAHAHEFMTRLAEGYATKLGTHGNLLSTGQAQRIALAQAFLRQSQVIILDEATSALDSHTEQLIQKTYNEMRGNCTLIVIAHRYATIADADRIIYLNGDGSVDVGTHDELIEQHQHYRQASIHQRLQGTTTI